MELEPPSSKVGRDGEREGGGQRPKRPAHLVRVQIFAHGHDINLEIAHRYLKARRRSLCSHHRVTMEPSIAESLFSDGSENRVDVPSISIERDRPNLSGISTLGGATKISRKPA